MEQENESKKSKALARWKFLGQMLSQRQCRIEDSISVRRFSSFGLLESSKLRIDKEKVCLYSKHNFSLKLKVLNSFEQVLRTSYSISLDQKLYEASVR